MLSTDWLAMIGCIPVDKHDSLCLLTTGGLHINVQSLLRKADDFLVVRGRIGGSTDAGYTFMIPYSQLECVYLHKTVAEIEVVSWFSQSGAPSEVAAAAPRVGADGVVPLPSPLVPAAAVPQPAAPGILATASIQTKSGSIPLPGKAAILERLRKRTGNSAPGTFPRPPLPGPAPGPAPGATPNPPEPPK
jgi:hypothetical protein